MWNNKSRGTVTFSTVSRPNSDLQMLKEQCRVNGQFSFVSEDCNSETDLDHHLTGATQSISDTLSSRGQSSLSPSWPTLQNYLHCHLVTFPQIPDELNELFIWRKPQSLLSWGALIKYRSQMMQHMIFIQNSEQEIYCNCRRRALASCPPERSSSLWRKKHSYESWGRHVFMWEI